MEQNQRRDEQQCYPIHELAGASGDMRMRSDAGLPGSAGLHPTSPHINAPVAAILMDRCDFTLGRMSAQQAAAIAPHAEQLQMELDSHHLSSLQHGMLHLDLCANNIGVSQLPSSGKYATKLLDWI